MAGDDASLTDVIGISGDLERIFPELALLFDPVNYWERMKRYGRVLERLHRLAIRQRILKVAAEVSTIYSDPDDGMFARLEAVDRDVQPFYGLDQFLSENYERALVGFRTIESSAFAAWPDYPKLKARFLTSVLVPFLGAPTHGSVEQRPAALLKGLPEVSMESGFRYAELLAQKNRVAIAERVCARLVEVAYERLRSTIDPPTFVRMGAHGHAPWYFTRVGRVRSATAEHELSEVVLYVRRRFEEPARKRIAGFAQGSLRSVEEAGRRSFEVLGLDTSFYQLETEGAAQVARALRSKAAGFQVGRLRSVIARDNLEHVERLKRQYGDRISDQLSDR